MYVCMYVSIWLIFTKYMSVVLRLPFFVYQCGICRHANIPTCKQTIHAYTYTHISMYIYGPVCFRRYLYINVHAYIKQMIVYIHACIYICMCVHNSKYVCIYACAQVCMYVRMYVCMYVCVYACMHDVWM